MLRNRKAHVDPVCLVPVILVLVSGAYVLSIIYSGNTVPNNYILVFAVLAILSQVVHLFHHGITPISGVFMIVIFIIALLLLRFSIGNVEGIGEFYTANMKWVVISIMGLDVIKTIAP